MVVRRVGRLRKKKHLSKRFGELPYEEKERLKILPHQAYWSERDRILLVELKQSERGNDYSCNKAAIDTLYRYWWNKVGDLDEDDDAYFEVRFLQVNRRGEEVGWEDVETLYDLTRDHVPRVGDWGKYFFVREETFHVVNQPGKRKRRGFFSESLPI